MENLTKFEVNVKGQRPSKPILHCNEEEKQEASTNLPAAESKLSEVPEMHVKRKLFCCPQGHDSGGVERCEGRMEKGQSLFFLFFLYAVRVKTKGGFVLRYGFALTHPEDLNSVSRFSSFNAILLCYSNEI